jgi:hypothetical protein
MHRPGVDPENMTAEDFICDFCHNHWTETRPMVEGHRGSLICGECLRQAYFEVFVAKTGLRVPEHLSCALCLMNKFEEPHYQSTTIDTQPVACEWCIKRSAGLMERDPDANWKKPG